MIIFTILGILLWSILTIGVIGYLTGYDKMMDIALSLGVGVYAIGSVALIVNAVIGIVRML